VSASKATPRGDVSPAREFCEKLVAEALGRDPEMTLGYLKGVRVDRLFRVPSHVEVLRRYLGLSDENLDIARLAYRSLAPGTRPVPSFLLMGAIEALNQADENAMHSLMWSGAGLAYAGAGV